ncbi:MAG: ABC transporter ATP-binding protein, partial [Alphaproteobacteria bacterium]|nr:ABC transporter ATP-binding protein [Alphaproteobacteria bacterium]
DCLGWKINEGDIEAASMALASLGMTHLAQRHIKTLSGGQQQLVLIAQRLIRQPEVLILDESTSALDIHHQTRVMEHLRTYVSHTGALVLIAMHDLNLATRHTDSLVLLSEGRITSYGNKKDVLTVKTIKDAYKIDTELIYSSDGTPVIIPLSAAAAC